MIASMRVCYVGGGTMGHVNPALAVHDSLKDEPGYECLFIGSHHSIEKQAVEAHCVPFVAICSGKLRRYASLRNFTDLFLIIIGFVQAFFILLRYRPDVLFSKGGYVSVPVVFAAHLLHIPIVTHESDALPGLSTRLNSKWARYVCIAFPEASGGLPEEKVVVTGNPIRPQLFSPVAYDLKQKLGISGKLVFVIGGSLGSHQINQLVWDNLDELTKSAFIYHQSGKADWRHIDHEGYCCVPYVEDEINEVYHVADLVISRSGAGTIGEICHYGKASLLIPLPRSASRGDQILNADRLEEKGAAVVLKDERDFLKLFHSLLEDDEKRSKLGKAAHVLATDAAAGNIADVIKRCAKKQE